MQDIKDEATINSLLSHRKIRFNIYPNKEVGSAEIFLCPKNLRGRRCKPENYYTKKKNQINNIFLALFFNYMR